jgi:hypothetical protein
LVKSTAADVVATFASKNWAADSATETAAVCIEGATLPVAVTLPTPATHAFAHRVTRGTADTLGAADLVLEAAHAMAGNRCAAANILI